MWEVTIIRPHFKGQLIQTFMVNSKAELRKLMCYWEQAVDVLSKNVRPVIPHVPTSSTCSRIVH